MSYNYKNSEQFKKAIALAEKQKKLYSKVAEAYANMDPETEAEFQKISTMLSKLKDSIDKMPGVLVMAEILKKYAQEARENEGLTESEFEEKYSDEIKRSENLGRNGWVISQHSSPADIEYWEELLSEGEANVAEYFDGDSIVILDVIIDELTEKYKTDVAQIYFQKGLAAFEDNDYMTAAMYLFALLDYRIDKLVAFPDKRLRNKEKYSNEGFANQKAGDFKQLSEKAGLMSKKIYFLEMYPSLIQFLNRIFYDEPYPFNKNVEPPYLNRNWLMHGRMTRKIERYECIQILNALSVIEFMFME
ncbi:MAG: hypothetical protein J1E65_04385 [Lachnospiraceae bacterium]|nr:hypothetical protein [Lachnospiraceae bacterium]